ncbi:COX15/CtaA family protein [Pseudobdellovibrio sp. HCB154]|uniref:COX15/CtaA family protein n=1 Tax=Pseudobdellovibrio sp. HCB154 TaxID=3386277 RepID=UPI0039171069
MTPQEKKSQKLLLAFWVYTLIVIFWGAWVRISHSGDGCGDHWPLCQAEFIPDLTQKKTFVEYFHRLMTGAYGIIVFFIFFKLRNHARELVRKLNFWLLVLMITEALIGALLVKLSLVTVNDSYMRLLFMILHQLNSFMLTGVTYLLFKAINPDFSFKPSKKLLLFLVVSVTGAIAALSVTLFPSISLLQGIIDDFSHDSHIFIKLRIVHPFLAVTIMSGFMVWLFMKNQTRFALEILFAMFIGVITLVTLSPVGLKIAHLGIAHVLWARFLSLNWNTLKTKT